MAGRQAGFFDVDERLERLSGLGDQLEAYAKAVDFELFRPELEAALAYADGGKGGRPPFDPIMMFKILVIQAQNNLSDERAEFLINDRLSFMRFLGLSLGDRVPDATTIWLFRERLVKAGAIKRLFDRFEQLSGDGDEGDHLGLSGGDEALVEGFEDRVVLDGDHGAHEERAADGGSAGGDEGLAAPLARLAGERCQTGQGRHLAAVERAELGQLGDERAGDRRADAGHGGQEILLLAPEGRAADGIVDLAIDVRQLLLQRLARRWMLFFIRFDARFSRCPSATIIWMICRRRAIRSAKRRGLGIGQGPDRRLASPGRTGRSPPHRSDRSSPACRVPGQRPAPAPD
jgi:hypothetical protein